MPYIELSGKRGKGHRTLVDDNIFKEQGHLSWFLGDTGYAMRRPSLDDGTKVTIRLHRLITNVPEGVVVDHLNGNRLDNRLSNLRICTQKENAMNHHGTIGYCFDRSKRKWMVRYRGRFYGRYETEVEAKRMYQLARSGVEYEAGLLKHKRRKYLPTGVLYMKNQSKHGRPYYIRPQRDNIRYFQGYFGTIQEAEEAYNKFLNKEK